MPIRSSWAASAASLALLATLFPGSDTVASGPRSGSPSAQAPPTYAAGVLRDRPAAFLQGTSVVVGRGRNGVAVGNPKRTRLPNGDPAFAFNGRGQYLSFANRRQFRIPTTGVLTVEFWMRPDALQFRSEEGDGYVHVLGKGRRGQHEWYGRMYSKRNSASRPNRISGYAFNSRGGLGVGSYFQDAVRPGRWMHVALIFNTRARSHAYPMGYTKIYKNGRLRDKDSLRDHRIVCRPGKAPLRLGTGYRDSYFKGALGNVAFYGRELSASQLRSHFRAM